MSGLAVLREAKGADPAVGVIMLTGVLDEAVGQQALQAGAFDFVTKPMDLKHLNRILWYKLTTMTLPDADPLLTHPFPSCPSRISAHRFALVCGPLPSQPLPSSGAYAVPELTPAWGNVYRPARP